MLAFAVMLTFSMFCGTTLAKTKSGKCGKNVKWTLTDKGVLTISGKGAMKNYKTDIAPWFLTSIEVDPKIITVKSGVTKIGSWSFIHCDAVKKVNLPNTVNSIGDGSFYYCTNLKSITIPKNVKTIGDSAFCFCKKVNKITIPKGTTKIGNEAFSYTGITSVSIPKTVKNINRQTFDGCTNLKKVSIPEGVKTIGDYAFNDTRVKTFTIPKSVKKIGKDAFGYMYNSNGRKKIPGFMIKGYQGSAAQKYAKKNGFKFVKLKK